LPFAFQLSRNQGAGRTGEIAFCLNGSGFDPMRLFDASDQQGSRQQVKATEPSYILGIYGCIAVKAVYKGSWMRRTGVEPGAGVGA